MLTVMLCSHMEQYCKRLWTSTPDYGANKIIKTLLKISILDPVLVYTKLWCGGKLQIIKKRYYREHEKSN